MERQELSLRNILLQAPEFDIEAAAVDLEQRLGAALGAVAPDACARVRCESDWLAIDLDPGSADDSAHAQLLAALAATRGAWYRELLDSIHGSAP